MSKFTIGDFHDRLFIKLLELKAKPKDEDIARLIVQLEEAIKEIQRLDEINMCEVQRNGRWRVCLSTKSQAVMRETLQLLE